MLALRLNTYCICWFHAANLTFSQKSYIVISFWATISKLQSRLIRTSIFRCCASLSCRMAGYRTVWAEWTARGCLPKPNRVLNNGLSQNQSNTGCCWTCCGIALLLWNRLPHSLPICRMCFCNDSGNHSRKARGSCSVSDNTGWMKGSWNNNWLAGSRQSDSLIEHRCRKQPYARPVPSLWAIMNCRTIWEWRTDSPNICENRAVNLFAYQTVVSRHREIIVGGFIQETIIFGRSRKT